jgi:hypothetical protein
MNRIHRIHRTYRILGIVAGLAGALLAAFATGPAAFAALVPANGGATGVTPIPQAPVRVVTAGGMAGWQITLIALGASLFAAAAAVLIDRARTARRGVATTSA